MSRVGKISDANAQYGIAGRLSVERGEFVEREGQIHQAVLHYEQAIKLLQKSGNDNDSIIDKLRQKILTISAVSGNGGSDEEKKRADLLKERSIARVTSTVTSEDKGSSEFQQRHYEINRELSGRHFSGIRGDKAIGHNRAIHEGIDVAQEDLDNAMLNYNATAEKAMKHNEFLVAGNTYIRVYEMLMKNSDETRAGEFVHKAIKVLSEGGDFYFNRRRYSEAARSFERVASLHMKLGEEDSARTVIGRAIDSYMEEANDHLRKKMKRAAVAPIELAIRALDESGITDTEKRNELMNMKENIVRDTE